MSKFTLKAARVNCNMTQAEAAKAIGITEQTLLGYEKGRKFPDVRILKRIEKAYGIGYNDLIFLPEDYGETVITG